tara:strand:- start:7 stop:228 length:222 start_codon:yes stop_codon:yes gene_type:complete
MASVLSHKRRLQSKIARREDEHREEIDLLTVQVKTLTAMVSRLEAKEMSSKPKKSPMKRIFRFVTKRLKLKRK